MANCFAIKLIILAIGNFNNSIKSNAKRIKELKKNN